MEYLQIVLYLSHGSHFLSYHSRLVEPQRDLVIVDTMESFKDPLKKHPASSPASLGTAAGSGNLTKAQ